MACRLVQRRQSEMRRGMARRQALARRGSIPTHLPSIPGSAFPKPIISRRLSRYDPTGSEGGVKSLLLAISAGDLKGVEAVIEEIKDTVTLLNKDMFHVILAAIKTGDPMIVARVMLEVKAKRYFPVRYLTTLLIEAIHMKDLEMIKSVKTIQPKVKIKNDDVVHVVFEALDTLDPNIVLEVVKSPHFKRTLSNENAFQILTKALGTTDSVIISAVVSNFTPKSDLSAEHKLTVLRYAVNIQHVQTVQFCFKLKSFLTPDDAREILFAAAQSTAEVFNMVHNALNPMLNGVPIEDLLKAAIRGKRNDVVQMIMRKYKIFDSNLTDLLVIHCKEHDPDEAIVTSVLNQLCYLPENAAVEILSAIILHDLIGAITNFPWKSYSSDMPNIVAMSLIRANENSKLLSSDISSMSDEGSGMTCESRDHSDTIRAIILKCRSLDLVITTQVIKKLSSAKDNSCLSKFLGCLNELPENEAKEVLWYVSQSIDTTDVVELLLGHCTCISLDDLDTCIRRCQHDKVRQLLISHRRRIVTKQFRKQYGDVVKDVYFGYDSKKEIILVAVFRKRPPLLMSDFMSYSVSNKIMPLDNETEI